MVMHIAYALFYLEIVFYFKDCFQISAGEGEVN